MKEVDPQLSSIGTREYKSLNTGQMITPANYIAEIMCQRKAEIENSGNLPKQYWNTTKYKNYYKSQLTKASTLLHKYDAIAIINAVKKSYKVYSLRPKWFEAKIVAAQKILEQDRKSRKEVKVRESTPTRKPAKSKNVNLFGEL